MTVDGTARGEVARLGEAAAWQGQANIQADRITYQGATLDTLAAQLSLRDGRLNVPKLAANLNGQPLTGAGELGVAAPYPFNVKLDVSKWDISDVLSLVPNAPKSVPIDGAITAVLEASGQLAPRTVRVDGQGRIANLQASQVTIGDVPFRVATEKDAIVLDVVDAQPFGGQLSMRAQVPTGGDQPVRAEASFANVDLAQVAAALPESSELSLTGKADGKADLVVRPDAPDGTPPLELDLSLKAPDLTVQGLAASGLQADVNLLDGVLHYDLYAESLGGKVKLKGSAPVSGEDQPAPANPARTTVPQARLQAAGFTLDQLWQVLGIDGALTDLEGQWALDANLAGMPSMSRLRLGGVIEARELTWNSIPIGNVRAVVYRTPTSWRIARVSGTIFGGTVEGSARGTTPSDAPTESRFDARIRNFDLAKVLAFQPSLAQDITGTGTLHLAGQLAAAVEARGELLVDRAQVLNLPLTEARVPLRLTYTATGPVGHLVLDEWQARYAGGQLRGNAEFRMGFDRSYKGVVHVDNMELESFSRIFTEARRPASGKISGQASFHGPDITDPLGLEGQILMDLVDASVFDLPVFRELSRFLGSTTGGVFEDGEFRGTISRGQVLVEALDLAGRIAQLHAEGIVNFDTRLDLKVLINTAQIIPETGQALLRIIPGLSQVIGRREQAVAQVANFLSNRLLKVHVGGTLSNPQVMTDPTILVTETALGFFGSVFKIPFGLLR